MQLRHQRRQIRHLNRGSGDGSGIFESSKIARSLQHRGLPTEMIKNGGEAKISCLTIICNTIWGTGELPTSWSPDQVYYHHPTQERKYPDM